MGLSVHGSGARWLCLSACLFTLIAGAEEGEWSGNAGLEGRYFTEDPLDRRQYEGGNLSLSFEPQYHRKWDKGNQEFTFKPFFRVDQHDSERSHADIRELEWIMARQDWELRLGMRKVFWGVTESVHLVDIINQTDLVENPDGEDKLGQPMLNLALIGDWGTFDIIIMPWFRERTFPGVEGRLRLRLPVETSLTRYASGAGRHGFDWALRWSHSIGDWDIGLSHFSGTSRDPVFELSFHSAGEPVLAPVYHRIDQTGLDAQFVSGDTLWKLELIRRVGHGESFIAGAGGFEHTLYGVFDSAADLGLLAEYLFSDKDGSRVIVFENDLFLGLRLALNDVQDTQVLFGIIQDLDDSTLLYNLETSRRLGDDWRLGLEARFFTRMHPRQPQWAFRQDDYFQLELSRYF